MFLRIHLILNALINFLNIAPVQQSTIRGHPPSNFKTKSVFDFLAKLLIPGVKVVSISSSILITDHIIFYVQPSTYSRFYLSPSRTPQLETSTTYSYARLHTHIPILLIVDYEGLKSNGLKYWTFKCP